MSKPLMVAGLRVALWCFCSLSLRAFFSVIIYGYECITVTKSFTVTYIFLVVRVSVCTRCGLRLSVCVCVHLNCAGFGYCYCHYYKCWCCCRRQCCFGYCTHLIVESRCQFSRPQHIQEEKKKRGAHDKRRHHVLFCIHKWLQSQIMLLRHYICGSHTVYRALLISYYFVNHRRVARYSLTYTTFFICLFRWSIWCEHTNFKL